jgi:hypothetical protein
MMVRYGVVLPVQAVLTPAVVLAQVVNEGNPKRALKRAKSAAIVLDPGASTIAMVAPAPLLIGTPVPLAPAVKGMP